METVFVSIVIVALLFTAVASLGFASWVIIRISTAHLPVTVAAAIAKQVEDSVRARVRISNDLLQGKQPESLGSIEEAPVPSFFQSGMVNDFHEIHRDLNRHRNADADRAATIRDLGIGVEEA